MSNLSPATAACVPDDSELVVRAGKGSRFSQVAVRTVIAPEFERLKRLHGGQVTTEQLLDSARSPESPLHQYFEWDNEVAAEEYRKQQARAICRAVLIIQVTADPSTTVQARAYHSVRILTPAVPGQSGQTYTRAYTDLDTISRNPHLRRQLLHAVRSRLASLQEAVTSLDKMIGANDPTTRERLRLLFVELDQQVRNIAGAQPAA